MDIKELRKLILEEKTKQTLLEVTVAARPSAMAREKQPGAKPSLNVPVPQNKMGTSEQQVAYARGAFKMRNELKLKLPQMLKKSLAVNIPLNTQNVEEVFDAVVDSILREIQSELTDPEAKKVIETYLV